MPTSRNLLYGAMLLLWGSMCSYAMDQAEWIAKATAAEERGDYVEAVEALEAAAEMGGDRSAEVQRLLQSYYDVLGINTEDSSSLATPGLADSLVGDTAQRKEDSKGLETAWSGEFSLESSAGLVRDGEGAQEYQEQSAFGTSSGYVQLALIADSSEHDFSVGANADASLLRSGYLHGFTDNHSTDYAASWGGTLGYSYMVRNLFLVLEGELQHSESGNGLGSWASGNYQIFRGQKNSFASLVMVHYSQTSRDLAFWKVAWTHNWSRRWSSQLDVGLVAGWDANTQDSIDLYQDTSGYDPFAAPLGLFPAPYSTLVQSEFGPELTIKASRKKQGSQGWGLDASVSCQFLRGMHSDVWAFPVAVSILTGDTAIFSHPSAVRVGTDGKYYVDTIVHTVAELYALPLGAADLLAYQSLIEANGDIASSVGIPVVVPVLAPEYWKQQVYNKQALRLELRLTGSYRFCSWIEARTWLSYSEKHYLGMPQSHPEHWIGTSRSILGGLGIDFEF